MNNSKEHEYSMTTLFYWESVDDIFPKYERRVTRCYAINEDIAKDLLLKESKCYATDNIKFLNQYWIQKVDTGCTSSVSEVSSELTLGLNPYNHEYLSEDTFVDIFWCYDKVESCEDLGKPHSWYRKDSYSYNCYNCMKKKSKRVSP